MAVANAGVVPAGLSLSPAGVTYTTGPAIANPAGISYAAAPAGLTYAAAPAGLTYAAAPAIARIAAPAITRIAAAPAIAAAPVAVARGKSVKFILSYYYLKILCLLITNILLNE